MFVRVDALLKKMREKGFTQKDLAEACGVSPAIISSYIGVRGFPKPSRAGLIAEVLDTPLEELFSSNPC